MQHACETICGQQEQSPDDAATARDALLAELAKVASLGAAGPPALPLLARLAAHLDPAAHDLGRAGRTEYDVQRLQQEVIAAMSAAARSSPWSLAAVYRNASLVCVRDSACEAASLCGMHGHHPALLAIQVAHLGQHVAVAALSLAAYGEPATAALLQDALVRELAVPSQAHLTAITALREALRDLGVPDQAQIGALASQVVATNDRQGRGAIRRLKELAECAQAIPRQRLSETRTSHRPA